MANALRFKPVEGSAYSRGFRDGLKLLVLGESHWGDGKDLNGKDLGSEMTCYWLKRHVEGERENRSPTFAKCETLFAFCGPYIGSDVWKHVTFANFVQVRMSDRDTRPKEVDWESGRDAFPELLSLSRPDVMLVLGRTTWNNLHRDNGKGPFDHEDDECLRTGRDQWGIVYKPSINSPIVAGFVDHPAFYGWRAETWYPHVERLLSVSKVVLGK